MFKTPIRCTELTSEQANGYFGDKIAGDAYNFDASMVSTLRAMLAPRIHEGEVLKYSDWVGALNTPEYYTDPFHRAFRFTPDITANIFSLTTTSTNYDEWVAWLSRDVREGNHKDWQRIEKVTAFFSKAFKVACFVNPTRKNVLLFTEDLSMRKFHYLQCGILAFFPWYFKPEDGVSDEEMALINSLRNDSADDYVRCINAIAQKLNIREGFIKQSLSRYEASIYDGRISALEDAIRDYKRNLQDLQERYASTLQAMNGRMMSLASLVAARDKNDGKTELMDYFLQNKRLKLDYTNGTQIGFTATGYLEYFDEDMARTYLDNPRSYFFRRDDDPFSHEEIKLLMENIFITRRFKVRVYGKYVIDSYTNSVNGRSGETDSDLTLLPNPHIFEYACLGGNGLLVSDMLSNGDYVSAIEQCVCSAQSLNIADGAVMQRFIDRFCASTNSFLEDAVNGNILTPKEAIEELKSEKGEEVNE